MRKTAISDGHFIVEFFWMSKLGLKGNELRLYALIYSYSQDNKGAFFGSVDYIKRRLSLKSRTSVFELIKKLEGKNLIRKVDAYQGNIRMVQYEIIPNAFTGTENVPVVQKMDKRGPESVLGGGTENVPNNKVIDNKEIEKDLLDKPDRLDRSKEINDLEAFNKHHILTRYLINSGYLASIDNNQLFRYDRYFDKFIGENGYTFDDYKLFVQYFAFRNQERTSNDELMDVPLKNKYGYFITAMEKARWEFSQEKEKKMKEWRESLK
jgi:hypothetical protein